MPLLEPFNDRNAAGESVFAGYLVNCPGCDMLHAFYTVPNGKRPCWEFDGNLEAPTFSPSLLVRYPWGDPPKQRRCHSFVRAGQWKFLKDCTHKLAGQTVDMVDID